LTIPWCCDTHADMEIPLRRDEEGCGPSDHPAADTPLDDGA
jgi:hypothetical protein